MASRCGGARAVLLLGITLGAAVAQDSGCLDDASGIAASTGNTCVSISAFGCDIDMAAIGFGVPEGTMVSAVCPNSCESCSQTGSAAACPSEVAVRRVNDVMQACCPGGGHRRAQAGGSPTCDLPEACPNEECAVTFITLMDDCQDWLQQNWPADQMAQFHRFKDRCEALSAEEEGGGIASCTATCGGVPTTGQESCVSDGWQWNNLPCAPHMHASDRSGEINPDHDVRCHCHSIYSPDADYAYSGPQSAAECAHVLCHYSGSGTYLFDSCSWDGEVIATARPAKDQSRTTITSDPSIFCVSCTQTTVDGATNWDWDNLQCEPGMDFEASRYDEEPEGNERCQCHDSVTGLMQSYDGPASAAQCGHLTCDPTYDYCAWDGNIVATATAGAGESSIITSNPDALCDDGVVRPTCTHSRSGGWLWSNLACEPTIEAHERRWDDEPEHDERCTW